PSADINVNVSTGPTSGEETISNPGFTFSTGTSLSVDNGSSKSRNLKRKAQAKFSIEGSPHSLERVPVSKRNGDLSKEVSADSSKRHSLLYKMFLILSDRQGFGGSMN
ncbi:hypothetical protein PanWU01x14_139540, partial [Parasponia andersonii]